MSETSEINNEDTQEFILPEQNKELPVNETKNINLSNEIVTLERFEQILERMYTFFLEIVNNDSSAMLFLQLINKEKVLFEDYNKELYLEFPHVHGIYKGSDQTLKEYFVYMYDENLAIWIKLSKESFADKISSYINKLLRYWMYLLSNKYDKIIAGLRLNDHKLVPRINYVQKCLFSSHTYVKIAFTKNIADVVARRLSLVRDDFVEKLNSKSDLLPVCWTWEEPDKQMCVYDLRTGGPGRLRTKEDYFTEYIDMGERTEDDKNLLESFLRDITVCAKVDANGKYETINKDIIIGYDENNNPITENRQVGIKDEEKSNELYKLLKIICGYVITGEISLQVFFIIIGIGANGKSGLYGMFKKALKKYAGNISASSLCGKPTPGDNPTPSIMEAENRRLLISSEMGDTDILNESKVKMMTGDDELQGSKKYGALTDFVMRAKILIGCNSMAAMNTNSYAMVRRPVMIPFNACFDDSYEKYFVEGICHTPIIENMNKRLTEPGVVSAFIEWCVQGSHLYYSMKDVKRYLKKMNKYFGALDEYLNENDTVKAFVDKNCTLWINREKDLLKQFNDGKITKQYIDEEKLRYSVLEEELFEEYNTCKIGGVKIIKRKPFIDTLVSKYRSFGVVTNHHSSGGRRLDGICIGKGLII